MTPEDKDKLFALKYYISKAAKAKLRATQQSNEHEMEMVALRDQNLIPHTVFLMPMPIEVSSMI